MEFLLVLFLTWEYHNVKANQRYDLSLTPSVKLKNLFLCQLWYQTWYHFYGTLNNYVFDDYNWNDHEVMDFVLWWRSSVNKPLRCTRIIRELYQVYPKYRCKCNSYHMWEPYSNAHTYINHSVLIFKWYYLSSKFFFLGWYLLT